MCCCNVLYKIFQSILSSKCIFSFPEYMNIPFCPKLTMNPRKIYYNGGFPLAISGLPDNLTFIDLDSNYRHLNNQKFSEALTILILRCVNDYFCNGYDESNVYDEF